MLRAIGSAMRGVARGMGKMGGEAMERAVKAPETTVRLAKPIVESSMPSEGALSLASHAENAGQLNPRKGLEILAEGNESLKYGESMHDVMDTASKNLPTGGRQAPAIESTQNNQMSQPTPDLADNMPTTNPNAEHFPQPFENIQTLPSEKIVQVLSGGTVSNDIPEEKEKEEPRQTEKRDGKNLLEEIREAMDVPPPTPHHGNEFHIVSENLEQIPEAFPGGDEKDVAKKDPTTA